MELTKIKEGLSKDIETLGYHLYELSFEEHDHILHVFLDESLDLNQIEKVSESISGFIDKYDEELPEYLLDVTCVGVERPIKNENEVIKAIGSYIYIKTKTEEVYGDLLSYENDILTLEIKDKNLKKVKSLNYKDVKNMRYAVKF